jgi:ATP-dependent Clp endopeptidase proteolytic subunit ClpP
MKLRYYFLSAFTLGFLLQAGCVINLNGPFPDQASTTARAIDFEDPVLLRRQILLFGDINEQSAERVTEQMLFLEGQSQAPIELYLMTPGGEFKSAMAIEQVMRSIKSPVNTYALAECNSGGTLLLAAGTGKRRAFKGAMVVVHGIKIHGKPPAGAFNIVQESYTQFWRHHAHLPESWLPLPPDSLHVLSADQALQYGVIDELIENK